MKLRIGQKAPDFTLPSHLDVDITLSDLQGKYVILAFYPQAWTPVWTAQIPSYEALRATFEELNVQVLGISIDHVPCIKAWAESLGKIRYPLLSDFWPHGNVAKKYGVLRKEGYTERAIFILDRDNIIRYIDIHNIDDQPNNDELMDELKRIIPGSAKLIDRLYKGEEEPTEDVVMYCTPWCVDCPKARKWLKDNNIPYTEIDISTDLAAARQVRAWGEGFQVTPTFNIKGDILLDFKEDKLKELLLKK